MNRVESFNNIADCDLYLSDGTSDNKDHQLEMSNISWASLVEEELGKSLEIEEISLSKSSDELLQPISQESPQILNPHNPLNLTIDDIIIIDFKKLPDTEILRNQSTVINYIRKCVNAYIDYKESSSFNKQQIINYLKWMSSVSEYLCVKTGLNINQNKKKYLITIEQKVIPRSSYQFCSYRHECEFNYNHEKHKGCFAQHFVHNLVYDDLNILMSYLISSGDQLDNINFNQLKKCIDTISFVINHMTTELSNLQYFNIGDINKLHIDRTPVDAKSNKQVGNRKKNYNSRINNKTTSTKYTFKLNK
jgi:hypothetical protein